MRELELTEVYTDHISDKINNFLSSYVPAPRHERQLPADDDEEAEDEEEADDLADGMDDMDVDENGQERSKAKYMRLLVSELTHEKCN